MITLLSNKPLTYPRFLWQFLKGYNYPYSIPLGKQRGPDAVYLNLLKGLDKIGDLYLSNPLKIKITEHVGVLSGVNSALPWAIKAKQNGKIKRIIAGPNLVILPSDNNSIICAKEIDLVITPSKWVTDLYITYAPSLKDHITEWPIGVDEEYWSPLNKIEEPLFDILLYEKIQEPENLKIIENIRTTLEKKGIRYTTIKYGEYKPDQYLSLLRRVRGMIYLTESESQGVSLFEAWSCNVPVLAWDREYWTNGEIKMPASSSPYLTDRCGMRFGKIEEFNNALDWFINNISQNTFSARKYILDNFTLEKSAHNYLNFFKS